MSELKLDPEGYFEFDLDGGKVECTRGGRAIIYPLAALEKVLATGLSDIQKTLPYTIGLHLGEECGRQVKSALGDDLLEGELTPEDFLNHLNAVLALHGLGMLSLETWGELLLFKWELADAAADIHFYEFQEGVLAGMLSSVTGDSFEAASVDHDGGMRFIAGNAAMVDWTKLWMGEGCGLGEIVDRLHAGKHLEGEIPAE
jgi:hypothetical protein